MMKMRTWGGVLFGAALAIGTAFAMLPMEALAEESCQWGGDTSCNGSTHDHEVTVESGQEITEGTFNGKVTVEAGGKILSGTFENPVTLDGGMISGGTFNWPVTVNNGGKISGGSFESNIVVNSGGEISNFTDTNKTGLIEVNPGGKITGGTFDKQVQLLGGTIEGGTFKDANTNVQSGTIRGGTFEKFSYNQGTIERGTFKCPFTNNKGGSITCGTFNGEVKNGGKITGGTFSKKVINDSTGIITNGTFQEGIENSGGTVSLPSSTPEPSSTPAASKSTETSAPVHKHSFEWTVTKEPTGSENGLEEYRCKGCGAVEASQPISMYMFRVKELYGLVKDAPKGGAVTYDFGNLATISDYILAKMAERNDVAVTVSFTYNGEAHSITFPAGTDYTELLNDSEQFYGLLGLNGRHGISFSTIGSGV